MKYLVTGSAGYIGSHVINRLKKKNEEIIGLFHVHKPKIDHKLVKYLKADISDSTFIDLLPTDIDIIIHCAAMVNDFESKTTFYKVNVKGTERLVTWAKNNDISQMIHLSHIQYESFHRFNYYSETKKEIERILTDYIKNYNMPITIIRPGNVFGPGSPAWLIRIITTIQKNNLYLIDSGKGVFHHTYIENLVDAIELSIGNKNAIGNSFDITDGDDTITFQKYFSDIASIIGKSTDFKNISKKTALRLGICMLMLYRLTRIKPVITPLATEILTNKNNISITKAQNLLQYCPKITYNEAMIEIERWIKKTYDFA